MRYTIIAAVAVVSLATSGSASAQGCQGGHAGLFSRWHDRRVELIHARADAHAARHAAGGCQGRQAASYGCQGRQAGGCTSSQGGCQGGSGGAYYSAPTKVSYVPFMPANPPTKKVPGIEMQSPCPNGNCVCTACTCGPACCCDPQKKPVAPLPVSAKAPW